MSKFLKFIVNLVLICSLLAAAALLVPSFAGIDMNIIKNERTETNLAVGTVTYGKTKDVAEIAVGDKVYIKDTDGSEYLYSVTGVDAENASLVLRDATNDSAEAQEKEVHSASVVLLTVPFLGYLAVAAGTVKGWIIIGLVALLLLLMFVLSEIWRKDKLQEEEEDDEDGFLEEEDLSRAEKKRQKKEKKAKKKAKKKAAAYEDDEDDEYEEYLKKKEEKKASRKARKAAKKEAKHLAEDQVITRAIENGPETDAAVDSTADLFEAARAEIASSVASAMAEENVDGTSKEEPEIDMEKALTQELAKAAADIYAEQASGEEKEDAPEAEEESQEIMIPIFTADELIRKAILAGDEPEVIEDQDLGITLIDYSSII